MVRGKPVRQRTFLRAGVVPALRLTSRSVQIVKSALTRAQVLPASFRSWDGA